MTKEELNEIADQYDSELLLMDGFDDCILGVIESTTDSPKFCYSKKKVIEKLMSMGMDEEGAIEFHEFNQAGAHVGEGTPAFLQDL